MAVDELVTQHPILRQSHKRVVYAHIPVRVVPFHGTADNGGALRGRGPRREVHIVHGDQNPPLHGLEAVPDVRKSATDDHAHGVRQVAVAQFVFDVQGRNGCVRGTVGSGIAAGRGSRVRHGIARFD